jgi:hypothetical protein
MSTKKTKSKKPVTTNAGAKTEQLDPFKVEGLFVVINMEGRDFCGSIPCEHNPTVVHANLGLAHTEATRLCGMAPGKTFAVFKCIGLVTAGIQQPAVRKVSDDDISLFKRTP